MTKDYSDLITAIEQQEGLAMMGDALIRERTDSLDYYFGRPLGNEVDGRSQVVARTVWDTVEWVKPQLCDVFCSGEEVVAFTPRGPEDVQSAQQETDYVNYIITEKNDWFTTFYGWAHDGLLQKNGYVKAYWDESEEVTTERYKDLTQDEFAALLQEPDIEIEEQEAVAIVEPMSGMQIDVSYNVTIKRTVKRGQVKIDNVPPECVRVSQDARGLSLQDPRLPFVQHMEYKAISDLRSQGFDVPDDIQDDGDGEEEWEAQYRDLYSPFRDRGGEEADPSMRRVLVRESWIRYDKNKDGKAELLKVIMVGTTVLDCEEVDCVGLVAACPTPMPHRHYGMSVADAVMDLQRIQTGLLRGAMDNQALANNGRYGINTKTVNLDDMLDSRPGGIVRVEGETGAAFFPLTHPTSGQQVIPMMEYVEKIVQRRTGISEMSQGLDPNALNNQAGADANSRMLTAAQQRIKFIARIFAETGVKSLFLLVHHLTLKHSRQQEIMRLRGQWVPVDPTTWKRRYDMSVTLTLGTGDKPQQIAMLQAIGMAQKEGMTIGIAKPKNLYHTAMKLTQLMGHKDVESFWVDPGEKEITPPPDPRIQVEQMRQEADIQRFRAEQQLSTNLETIKAQAKQQETSLQLQLQAANDARDSDREAMTAHYKQQLAIVQDETKKQIEAAKLEFAAWQTEYEAKSRERIAAMSQQTAVHNAQLSAHYKEQANANAQPR